jgi:hypothetical protein
LSWVQEPSFYVYPSLQGGKLGLLSKWQHVALCRAVATRGARWAPYHGFVFGQRY